MLSIDENDAYDLCPRSTPSAAIRDAARESRGAGRAADERSRGPGKKNVQLRSAADYSLQGRSLAELSRQARAELLDAAQTWTAAYREANLSSRDPQGLIFLAGHQPELFHPGVWFKNFALGAVARQHGARP